MDAIERVSRTQRISDRRSFSSHPPTRNHEFAAVPIAATSHGAWQHNHPIGRILRWQSPPDVGALLDDLLGLHPAAFPKDCAPLNAQLLRTTRSEFSEQ